MSLTLLFNTAGLNPSPDVSGASPFTGAVGGFYGTLVEVAKGNPTIWTAVPNTTAVRLVPSNFGRRSLVLANAHATQDMYFGFTSAVTTATGFYVPAKTVFPMELDRWLGEIWVVASGAGDARAIETLSV